ncbi:restriction endonuclease [Streptomyces sp. NBC_00825]|uniref:restriction endonuclease n=1 Tax=unclassified Streptomyces TaxID=2593676 RepID=UPI002ED502CA|nr:restriction endonuclease [Streptomyces sp. NBC_00826]WTH89198.1 restriction endonuclease [Streptomyces sp. NBC_00825]WTH97923.1 restriction endonuclease [Streptomyces sp. NBC_00822]
MTGIRLRWRRPRGRHEQVAAALVAVAVATMLVKAGGAAWASVVHGWPVAVALAAAGLLGLCWRGLQRHHRQKEQAALAAALQIPLTQIDALNDQEFEFALRDLLVRDGWRARQVGQKGDQAADVIGQHTQRGRIVLQAKHTTVGGKVDSKVMYQVKGTAGPVHRADIAVVVTNGGFTRDAKEWGERHQVHWVDRERLRQWADDGVPLHTLLRLPARRPRRSTTRRAA